MTVLKKIAINIAAILIGGCFVAMFESIGHILYPPPAHVDLNSPEGIAQIELLLAQAPIWALLLVGLAFFAGSFVAGYVCARFSHKPGIYITGVIMLFFGIQNFMIISHPMWFVVTAPLMQLSGTLLSLYLYPKIATE